MPGFSIHRTLKPSAGGLPLHSHRAGQLTFAASGMVQIHTDAGIWLVPPQLAAWVPAGTRHRLEIITKAELWIAHWEPAAVRRSGVEPALDRAFALWVTPLLRVLLEEAAALDPRTNKAAAVAQLMLYELRAMEDAPTFLPMPTRPATQRIAEAALSDRRHRMSLSRLASSAAVSVRTASRLFPAETGLTFKAWRQRARILSAMELLSRGQSPAEVAKHIGFSSTAAFSSAFRKVAAVTPTHFASQGR